MPYSVAGDSHRYNSVQEMLDAHWADQSFLRKTWWYIRLPFLRTKQRSGRIYRVVKNAWQRVFRGYDDFQLWNWDKEMTVLIGRQLIHMADIAHGWPGEQWGTFEQWVEQQRDAGRKLVVYGTHDILDDPKWAPETRDAIEAAYKKRHADAKEAFAWIGENLPHIWD